MPKRTPPPRRTSDRIIDELRESVLAGIPWIIPVKPPRGYGDLIFIVTGHHYPIACDFIHVKDDTETTMAIWSELREDILREHIKHRPGTRPWAWWKLEDREERRVVEIDEKMTASDGGRIYESEADYLARLGLLRRKEREALRELDNETP
jgi:hypothetical protein